MEDHSAISSAIAEILESSSSNQLVGARLQFELTKRFPEFKASNYGYRNLLDFVRQQSSRVCVVGRSGGDVIYGLREGVTRTNPSPDLNAVPNYFKTERAPSASTWRTFVSPNATCRIYANTETGELKNLPVSFPALDQPWVQVPSADAETHLQVARDFIKQIAVADHKEQLSKTLDQPVWWLKFSSLAQELGVDAEWRKYRHSRLWSEFEKTLQTAGVSPALVNAFHPIAKSPCTSTAGVGPYPANAELIRRIAVSAIQNASISDLRKIWLPLGAIVDTLENE